MLTRLQFENLIEFFGGTHNASSIDMFLKSIKFNINAVSFDDCKDQIVEKIIDRTYAQEHTEAQDHYARLFLYLFQLLSSPGLKTLTKECLIEELKTRKLSKKEQKLLSLLTSLFHGLSDRQKNIENDVNDIKKHIFGSRKDKYSILTTNTRQLNDPPKNPGTLLNARYEIVPFFDEFHKEILRKIDTWCYSEKEFGNGVFFGDGGTGKTRLFIEHVKRYREKGWIAGFLPKDISVEHYRILFDSSDKVFIVVDYAETRSDLSILFQILDEYRDRQEHIRIIFIARRYDWVENIKRISEGSELFLDDQFVIRAPKIPDNYEFRLKAFEHAYQAFSRILDRPSTKMLIPDLSDDKFGRFLYIQMAALASLEEIVINADTLLRL